MSSFFRQNHHCLALLKFGLTARFADAEFIFYLKIVKKFVKNNGSAGLKSYFLGETAKNFQQFVGQNAKILLTNIVQCDKIKAGDIPKTA
ncbi:MAG: hypothetical protein ACI4JT_07820 [Oscillospiraceae bacterium]